MVSILLVLLPIICIQLSSVSSVKLSNLQYNVGGDVSIKDEKVVIKNFSYSGAAPDAFFYIGTSGSPADAGTIGIHVQYPTGQDKPLGPYSGQDIEFALPADVSGADVTWVSVWCRQYSINFGHALLIAEDGAEAESEPESESEFEPESEPEFETESGAELGKLSLYITASLVFIHLLLV